jgi:ADP-ribose pyrophosphatase YjhB (NUDIX family)
VSRRAFSVAVFARYQDQILLIHHHRLGTWLPVGGELEPGETPAEAALRELREETGRAGRLEAPAALDGAPAGLLGYEEHDAGKKGLHLNLSFVAEVDRQAVVPNDEFSVFRWVSDLRDIDCPANVRQLAGRALRAPRSDR